MGKLSLKDNYRFRLATWN